MVRCIRVSHTPSVEGVCRWHERFKYGSWISALSQLVPGVKSSGSFFLYQAIRTRLIVDRGEPPAEWS